MTESIYNPPPVGRFVTERRVLFGPGGAAAPDVPASGGSTAARRPRAGRSRWDSLRANPVNGTFDYDWLVIGSGFGGSVSALRLAEKGYRVGILEAGRRYRDQDYAKSTWDLRRFLWAPAFGLRGIFRLTPFKDVFIASGSAVGGGSVVYANTLYRASPEFFTNPQWSALGDWSVDARAALRHRGTHARRADRAARERRAEAAAGGRPAVRRRAHVPSHSRRRVLRQARRRPCPTRTSAARVRSGPVARTAAPAWSVVARAPRTRWSRTISGSPKSAASRSTPSARSSTSGRSVPQDGSEGYVVTTQRPGAWFFKQRRTFKARGIVMSAGALGTNRLLAKCKLTGALPRISDRLGQLVRTNSESILAVTLPEGMARPWNDVAISASIYPRPDTHIEFVTYGALRRLHVAALHAAHRRRQPGDPAAAVARPGAAPSREVPEDALAGRLVAALGAVPRHAEPRQRHFLPGEARLVRRRLADDEQDPEKPNPTFIEVGNRAAAWLAREDRRLRAEHVARGLGQHPDHGAHPRRCGRRPGCRRPASSTRGTGSSATRISWSATDRRCRPTRASIRR